MDDGSIKARVDNKMNKSGFYTAFVVLKKQVYENKTAFINGSINRNGSPIIVRMQQ